MKTEITEATCKQAEFYETPRWAVDGILRKESLPPTFVDPCTGHGVIAVAARDAGYESHLLMDKHHWEGMGWDFVQGDFLKEAKNYSLDGRAVIMNPPFSLAEAFVKASLGADKILCFQRFAWWESEKRRFFWKDHPPARVYICGNRATCWRGDVPHEERKNGTTTAHAWFIFEPKKPHTGTTLHHIWKGE